MDDKDALAAGIVSTGVPEPQARQALLPWTGPNRKPEEVLAWARGEADIQVWCYVVYGPPGRGKSHLAWMVVGAYLRRYGRGALYRTERELRRGIMDDRKSDAPAFEAETRTCELLVIDDFGTERDGYADVFEELLSHREAHCLRTLITTNGRPADIGSERLLSRLRRARMVEMSGVDMRGWPA